MRGKERTRENERTLRFERASRRARKKEKGKKLFHPLTLIAAVAAAMFAALSSDDAVWQRAILICDCFFFEEGERRKRGK